MLDREWRQNCFGYTGGLIASGREHAVFQVFIYLFERDFLCRLAPIETRWNGAARGVWRDRGNKLNHGTRGGCEDSSKRGLATGLCGVDRGDRGSAALSLQFIGHGASRDESRNQRKTFLDPEQHWYR